MQKLVRCNPLAGYNVGLTFADGSEGVVDLSDLAGRGIFEKWTAPGAFEQAVVGDDGQLAWGDDIELCADALYMRLTGRSADDLFPILAGALVHA